MTSQQRLDTLTRRLRELNRERGSRLDLSEAAQVADELFGKDVMPAYDIRRAWGLAAAY
jgi:hypothetical protein